jgi:hypothetical protein
MYILGSEVGGGHGSGGGGCEFERRSSWGSVRIYFMISFCMLCVLMHGSDGMILTKVTPCMMHISFWLLSSLFPWMQLNNLFGTYMFPWKVSIFAWRLLCDRLPTKTNLVARSIINPASHLCVTGCGCVESAQHLFLSCSTFGSLWSSVWSWIGFSAVDSLHQLDDFLQLLS